jgi:hypothetical protein
MRRVFVAFIMLAFCRIMFAQTKLNNEDVIKMTKAGLSDDIIVSTIYASAGDYTTTADALIALKQAGVTDKTIAAVVSAAANMAAAPAPNPQGASVAPLPVAAPVDQEAGQPAAAPAPAAYKPRVFLQSQSRGDTRNAGRDQSMEMSKDFDIACPDVRVTINQQVADYTVMLNHIEIGLFVRDNQFQIANKDGDLISKTKEGGSILGGVKKACGVIIADYAKSQSQQQLAPQPVAN